MTILQGSSCSSRLALGPITALLAAKVGAMEGVLLGCVLLLLCPGIGTLPRGGEPYGR